MARKKRRFTATRRRPTVKRHRAVYKDSVAEEQTQNQEGIEQPQQGLQQAIPQTPVVASGFPESSVSRSPLGSTVVVSNPQPQTTPPAQQSMATPTPPPAQGVVQTQQSQDARLGISLREPVGSTMDTTVNSPRESTSIPPQNLEPQKKSKLWIILVVIIIIFAAVGGALYYFRTKAVKQAPKEEKVLPSATLAPVTPTVSPATGSANLKVDYLQYEIRVLNGSGIKGEASKVKDFLEEEKFVVKDIDNADSSDYEKTVIRAKKDVAKEYLDLLKSLLGKIYVLDTEEELGESASVDVIIIIGSSKKP